jgi:Tol biopolymer transport system component
MDHVHRLAARSRAIRSLTGSLLALAFTLDACTADRGFSVSVTPPASSATSPSPIASESPAQEITNLQGKILFTRAGGRYGDETVYTANADGSHERRITGFGKTCCPRWSPDGSHISFAAQAPDGRYTTGIVNPDGSNLRTIPLPPGSLNLGCAQAQSIVTGRVACEGWSDQETGMQGLYTVRSSDGGDLVRVTHCSPAQDDRPMDFSPDGSQIYFLRGSGDPLSGRIFVVDIDGRSLHPVTPRDLPVDVVGNAGGRLSPDGEWIVFTSAGVVWKIRSDGSELTEVFEDPGERVAITPTWSPNGRLILFGLDPFGSIAIVEAAPSNDLYVMRADGSDLTRLPFTNEWKREPDWVAAS